MVLAALLESGKLHPSTAWPCPIHLTLDGRRFDCSHPPLAQALHVHEAIACSCNCFVARAAERFAPGELARELGSYGLDANNTSGPRQRLQALGETDVLSSALDLARAYRQLALRLKSPSLAPVLAGLESAVEYGTGQGARIQGASVAGKTGSASASGGRHAAWFAGFMPSRAPEVAVAVMLDGRSGGGDAAPIAPELLVAYRAGECETTGTLVDCAAAQRTSHRTSAVRAPKQTLTYGVGTLRGRSASGRKQRVHFARSLEAMAVAARTYGCVCAAGTRWRVSTSVQTTHCQRVDESHHPPAHDRCTRNPGRVSHLRRPTAFTPYSSDCGGRGQDAGAVWPDHATPT